MKRKSGSRIFWLLICALLLSLLFPIAAGGQGRWYRSYPRSRTVIVYRTYRPYSVYRTRSYYYPSADRRPYYERYYRKGTKDAKEEGHTHFSNMTEIEAALTLRDHASYIHLSRGCGGTGRRAGLRSL